MTMRLIALGLLLLMGCGNDNGGPNGQTDGGGMIDSGPGPCDVITADFPSINTNILETSRCNIAGCHATNGAQGGLDLGSGESASHANLVGAATFNTVAAPQFGMRVVAGDPDNSYLFVKVSEPVPVGGGSGRMPPGPPLQPCQIDAIRDWIQAGAAQ